MLNGEWAEQMPVATILPSDSWLLTPDNYDTHAAAA
jgi:hypothetical protein